MITNSNGFHQGVQRPHTHTTLFIENSDHVKCRSERIEKPIIIYVFYSYFFVIANCIKSFYAFDRSLEIRGLKICVVAMKSPGKEMQNHSTKCWSFRFSHFFFILKWFCAVCEIKMILLNSIQLYVYIILWWHQRKKERKRYESLRTKWCMTLSLPLHVMLKKFSVSYLLVYHIDIFTLMVIIVQFVEFCLFRSCIRT